MKILQSRNREFWVGFLFLALGGLSFWMASHYRLGSLKSMGPGYFPIVLSLILLAIGLGVVFKSLTTEGEPMEQIALRPIFFIITAVLVTGWTLTHLGAVLSLPLLLGLSALADRELKIGPAYLLYIVAMTIMAVLLFVKLLGLPIPLFGTVFR